MPDAALKPDRRSESLRLAGGRALSLTRRPLVMGVLNITPDSFSDGGLFAEPGTALGHARRMIAAGADLINDISLLGDPHLAAAAARSGCPLIVMHSRGALDTMQHRASYRDLLAEVRRELAEAVERALAAGVDRRQLLVDPGIGFGKTARQNVILLRRLEELGELGLPLVVGASRKSFIARIAGDAPPDRRLGGSLAAVAAAARAGAAIVRVHDVAETVQFLHILRAIEPSGGEPGEANP